MSVTWLPMALDDREKMLDFAFGLALEKEDPQIWEAAEGEDLEIEAKGNALDEVATFQALPGMSGTFVYPGKGGEWVILYTRTGDQVEIERVCPTETNWKPSV